MPIQATRRLLHAALSGELDGVDYRVDEVFGFDVPVEVPGVERSLLDPRSTWRDPAAYDAKARELAAMFTANFEKFAADAGEAIAAAGPRADRRGEHRRTSSSGVPHQEAHRPHHDANAGSNAVGAAFGRFRRDGSDATTSSSSAPGAPACAQPSRHTTGARRSP